MNWEWYEVDNPPGGKLPTCAECGQTIFTEYKWHICGKYYCEDCAESLFREDNAPDYYEEAE